jgi:hypothetical protein
MAGRDPYEDEPAVSRDTNAGARALATPSEPPTWRKPERQSSVISIADCPSETHTTNAEW